MYQEIEERPSVPMLYANSLEKRGAANFGNEDETKYTEFLNDQLKRSDNVIPQTSHLEGHWKGFVQASEDKITTWDTGRIATVLQMKNIFLDSLVGSFVI